MKPILEALNIDGSIAMELMKGISRGCLDRMKERHAKGKFLGSFRPAQIFYEEVDGNVKIKFGELEIVPTEHIDSLSQIQWMAPEALKKNSKPTHDSDVFTLGLLFFFMLTNGGNPMAITLTFFKNEICHDSKINLKPLDLLRKDTDTILFIDLIKKMIRKTPDQRETCDNLIKHAALKSNEERLEIVQLLSNKCFFQDKCINEYLVKMMDKNGVHMKESLREESDAWQEFLVGGLMLPEDLDIKICSSLLKILSKQSHHDLLQPIMAAMPNFFPHLYNIYRDELPKMEERPLMEIFEHFNDEANALGTGSNHTRVYKGKFQRRAIAIKRVVRDLAKIVDREISIMLLIDRHPNILRYFAKEEDENFIYIGTELCEGNLASFIRDQYLREKLVTKTIFQQTVEGLNHLHQLNIIHRDVKPENILIFKDNLTYSVKLSDFGISKDLNATTLSTLNAPGTIAWIAPEVFEQGHTTSSDVFSLGCVFYFIAFNGTILSKELSENYKDVAKKLEENLQELINHGNNEQILQMNLLIRMLTIKQEFRPCAQKVLLHPLFWGEKKCLEFILNIRKKFDILDPKFASKIKNQHQTVLQDTPIVQKLKVALDLNKSVFHNDWKAKLDLSLAEEFKAGYDKESMSDLLRAIRNKWMHIIEMKDAIKALFGEGTESEFFNYFTLRFPRLLMHCYNAVEVEARHLLPEYFPLIPEPSGAVKGPGLKANEAFTQTPGIDLEGSKMIIRCIEVTTFPESKVHFEFLELKYIYYLFVERNKSFPNFLQRNGSNVTQLEFSSGSLKFESVNKILEKLPNLKKIQFDDVAYEASRTKQTIQPAICQNLVELVIESLNSSNLLQVFQECHTVKKLTVVYITITLEEILQKYPRVQELTVNLNYVYPVNHSNESKIGIHQLKVLKFELRTRDEMILEKLLTFIQKQKTLHQFSFDSDHHSPSQSFCKHLAAHICKLGRLNTLEIRGEHLLEEVEAFLEGSSQVANTRLEELACQLNHIRSLPSSFFGHFTSLRKLDIYCYKVNEIKVYENFITFMNQTKLAVIKLRGLPLATFQCFKHLQVKTLLVLDVSIDNELEDKVPVFEILQECLPNNPNITNFKIDFYKDCDESKSELVPMIVKSLAKLKSLQVLKYSQITPEIIKQIVPLKSLKFWEINDYKSETFYKP